ncbi:MAG: type IX secretion system membrane protein PorP/SprF [Bacteroidetes bacterium]|nr:MAG: type IX secretion system membrane protein PorP/SprF [Bacteroidota bacterium]
MRALLIFFFLICWGSQVLEAQQDEQFTQWMYHKIGFNPAYAGMQETPTFTGLYRQQWAGLEGAPQSQLLTFNMPLTSRGIGLGAHISRHAIGAAERYTADLAYAYRFNLGRGGRFGIGLSSSIRLIQVDFDQLEATEPKEEDPSIPTGLQSKYVPNFGAGIYYSNQTFYVGLSAPRLLTSNIDLGEESTIISREVPHYYLMAGVLVRLTEQVQMQPQLILKYLRGAPFDGDLNVNFIFSETVYTGVSYRLGGSSTTGIGEAGSVLLGMQMSDALLFGLAYDFTLSELRSYSSGTIEAVLRYGIGGRSRGNEILSPRFF